VYQLLIKQFLRTKTVLLAVGVLLLLGIVGIYTGKHFLNQKQEATRIAIQEQQNHLENQLQYYDDDIGLLLYYLKFSFINDIQPLASVSIGQSDLNAHIQNVKILTLEGQKYNTDLVNPMRLQVGNLDLSFLLIFLFPLVIIALNFNLLSEEIEKGTWRLITIQGKSPFQYLLLKLSVRLLFVSLVLAIIFLLAKFIINLPFNGGFVSMIVISYLYILFWFAVCFFVILFRKSSNANAIILLTTWLILVVLSPVLINKYITSKYPVEEAFAMTIKQRDEYHKRWDTDKKETMDKFYAHYPQFRNYELQEEGFSWLWYYAMQQMGDDQSVVEREAMYEKIEKREQLSQTIAKFFPPLQTQLTLNTIAETSLPHQIEFLNATTTFHEDVRLSFYPKIFEDDSPKSVNWEDQKPKYFESKISYSIGKQSLPILLTILPLIVFILGLKIGNKF